MTRGRRGLQTIVVSIAIVVGSSACGGGRPPEVAATVEGRSVRSADVERLSSLWLHSQLRQEAEHHARQVAQSQSGGDLPAGRNESLTKKEVARLVLGYLVRRDLLEGLASAKGIHLSDDTVGAAAASGSPEEELAAAGWGRSEIEGSFQAGRLSKALAEQVFPDAVVSDAEMRRRFDQRPELFARSWRANVRAAVFDTATPVAALQEAVRRGESFEAAAGHLGPRQNLDLGMVNSLRPLPEPIRAALAALQPGTVSAPVEAGTGFVALFVENREDLPALSFDEARPALHNLLTDEKRQDLFSNWFDKQLETAPITIAHFYGRWDRSGSQVL